MAPASRYDAFILDYGGVLVHHQSDSDQARLAEIADIPSERFSELYWSERLEYDRGLLSCNEYWNLIARKIGKTFREEQIHELAELDTASWMNFDEGMWDWLEQLKTAGTPLGMLSNMPRELGEALKTRTQRLRTFDQVTLSYEIHSVKPEPAIYEHCLNGLETTRNRTLFLDDRLANVEGAEFVGMKGLQFTSRDEILPLLKT